MKKVFEMTDEEKKNLINIQGSILLGLEEYRSIGYISNKLNLTPTQVEHNMEEILYIIRKRIGIRRFIKTIFIK